MFFHILFFYLFFFKLLFQVTEQLCNRFIPSPNLIKTRIESLIEKEILARDNSHHDVYNYVA